VVANVRHIDVTSHALPSFDTDILEPARLHLEEALSVLTRVLSFRTVLMGDLLS
jgi:hypothetical protein